MFCSRGLDSLQPTGRLAIVLAITLFIQTTWGPAALACSVRRADPGVGPVDPSELRLVRADGEDLVVDVEWSMGAEAAMILSLETGPESSTVASWSLATTPGTLESVRLDAALTAVADHGFTYRLRLSDDSGVSHHGLDFALAVDCPAEGCRYRVLDGVGGRDLPRIPLALWTAIEEARAQGVEDLFAHIREHRPELARHLPGLAWQLAKIPGGDSAVRGCSCRWIQVSSFDPYFEHSAFAGASGFPPTHLAGGLASGAGHTLLGQTYRTIEKTPQDMLGTTEFGIVTLCTTRSGAQSRGHATTWPSLPMLTYEEAVVAPCAAPCTPKVDYVSRAEVCALGFASAAASPATHAEAWAAASILLDGQMIVAMNEQAEAYPAPFSDAAQQESDYQLINGSRSTSSGIATITGTGSLDLVADNPGGGYDAYVLGGSTFGYELVLAVPQGCPGVEPLFPGVSIYSRMNDGNGQGGAVLRSWENFP